MAVDPKGLAVGIAQVALRAIDKSDVADMLGDMAGVPRRTPETVAYERFLRDVETNLAALRRGAVTSHPAEVQEIDAALEQVRVRFEMLLTSSGSVVAMAHLRPEEFRSLVRDESARERAQLSGVGPQVYGDALAHVTEAFIVFVPSLPQFAISMLTVIATGVAGTQSRIGRLEASGERIEELLVSALHGLRQASAHTGPVRKGTLPGRAPGFVDTGILERLADQVARGGQATLVSLTGLRGVGKTQVAAEFARRCVADGWPVIAWVNAESQESLTTDLVVLANEVVGVREGEATPILLGRWRAAWNSDPDPRRLLVLDNLTDAGHVRGLLPDIGAATVIATTSDAGAVISRHVLDVESWSPEQSVNYLALRTGLDDADGALRVAEAVGFLPLALAQASWVIGQRRRRKPAYGFTEYARELDAFPLDQVLIAERGGEYPLKTAQAIELSIRTTLDACESDGPGTAVLGVLAHLDPAGVPVAWLDSLDGMAGSLDGVLDAIEAGALVTPSQDGASIVMHRLVGRLLRGRPGTVWDEASDNVADVLASIDPLRGHNFWEQRQSATHLSSHVLAVLGHSVNATERLIDIAFRSGYSLTVLHLPQPARVLLERLIEATDQVLGPNHPTTLTTRNNLAAAYESAGDLGRAVPLFERTLADIERVLGPDHPDTLTSRNNLAIAYESAGDLDRAVPLFELNLTDRERVLGPDHPDTLTSRNCLAYAYKSAGNLDRAVPLFELNLTDRERVLGPDHPATFKSRNNLACVYESAGDAGRAVPLYERTLVDSERVLGPDHPATLLSRNNLAYAYGSAGDAGRAVLLHERTLADSERVLGPDHPSTLLSRNNLAYAYAAAEDGGRAVQLYERNLTDRERVLGPDHPASLLSRNNLALALLKKDQHARALELARTNQRLSAGRFGPTDSRTLRHQDTLRYIQAAAGDLDPETKTWREAHSAALEHLGADHYITHLLADRIDLD